MNPSWSTFVGRHLVNFRWPLTRAAVVFPHPGKPTVNNKVGLAMMSDRHTSSSGLLDFVATGAPARRPRSISIADALSSGRPVGRSTVAQHGYPVERAGDVQASPVAGRQLRRAIGDVLTSRSAGRRSRGRSAAVGQLESVPRHVRPSWPAASGELDQPSRCWPKAGGSVERVEVRFEVDV
jgi:hypothetical protein